MGLPGRREWERTDPAGGRRVRRAAPHPGKDPSGRARAAGAFASGTCSTRKGGSLGAEAPQIQRGHAPPWKRHPPRRSESERALAVSVAAREAGARVDSQGAVPARKGGKSRGRRKEPRSQNALWKVTPGTCTASRVTGPGEADRRSSPGRPLPPPLEGGPCGVDESQPCSRGPGGPLRPGRMGEVPGPSLLPLGRSVTGDAQSPDDCERLRDDFLFPSWLMKSLTLSRP